MYRAFAVLFLAAVAADVNFPDYWERCKVSPALDFKPNECLKKTVQNIIKYLADNGDDVLGMKDFDPFKVKRISATQSSRSSAVNLKVDFINPDLVGLSNLKINLVDGKYSSPQNWTFHVKAELDRFQILGDYKVDGRILVLPIVGQGDSNVTFVNNKVEAYIHGQPQIKNGKEYLKITDQSLSIKLSKMYIRLDNLFNGDRTLGETMNRVLNDNWELLYQELRSSMESEIMKHVAKYAKSILEKIPYSELVIAE